jgi:hypothetical protein
VPAPDVSQNTKLVTKGKLTMKVLIIEVWQRAGAEMVHELSGSVE